MFLLIFLLLLDIVVADGRRGNVERMMQSGSMCLIESLDLDCRIGPGVSKHYSIMIQKKFFGQIISDHINQNKKIVFQVMFFNTV